MFPDLDALADVGEIFRDNFVDSNFLGFQGLWSRRFAIDFGYPRLSLPEFFFCFSLALLPPML
jgi:hypothetical protein